MAKADKPGANPDPLEVARNGGADDEETPTFWFRWEVDGEPATLPFRLDEVEPDHVRRLRRATGYTTGELYRQVAEANDMDSAAAIWWLTRLQAGHRVTLDECELGVRFDRYPELVGTTTEGEPAPEGATDPLG